MCRNSVSSVDLCLMQTVVFTTTHGEFEAEIYADKMPITAGAHAHAHTHTHTMPTPSPSLLGSFPLVQDKFLFCNFSSGLLL